MEKHFCYQDISRIMWDTCSSHFIVTATRVAEGKKWIRKENNQRAVYVLGSDAEKFSLLILANTLKTIYLSLMRLTLIMGQVCSENADMRYELFFTAFPFQFKLRIMQTFTCDGEKHPFEIKQSLK